MADHPRFDLCLLAASSRSAGRRYEEATAWAVSGEMPDSARGMEVRPLGAEILRQSGVRLVFSALPSSAAGPVEDELRSSGLAVFSNAGAHRLDADVPVIIPEANAGHLELARRQAERCGGFIVTNSNCTTSGVALVLKPLEPFVIHAGEPKHRTGKRLVGIEPPRFSLETDLALVELLHFPGLPGFNFAAEPDEVFVAGELVFQFARIFLQDAGKLPGDFARLLDL